MLEPDGVGSEEKSDGTQVVVVLECVAAIRSREGDVVVFAEDAVGALSRKGRVCCSSKWLVEDSVGSRTWC